MGLVERGEDLQGKGKGKASNRFFFGDEKILILGGYENENIIQSSSL